MPFFHIMDFWPSLMGLFWIVGIVHCLVNKRLSGGAKVLWVMLMFFVNFIGTLIYFIYWYGSGRNRYQAPAYQPYQPGYTPYEPNYASYEQGYRPVQTPPTRVRPLMTDEAEPQEMPSSLYEQPQVMYPEDPLQG